MIQLFQKIPLLGQLAELLGIYRPPRWMRGQREWQAQRTRLERLGIGNVPYMSSLPPALIADIAEADRLLPPLGYRHFTKRKRDGRVRHLAEPSAPLKAIQRELLKLYLSDPKLIHPSALGYRPKRSAADHAWTHAGAQTIIVCDLLDFFPSTTTWRVESWWKSQPLRYQTEPMPEAFARVLTLLTIDNGALPQGAPTSPALSNVVNNEMDTALARKAKSVGAVYSRYVDDLVFSLRDNRPVESDFEDGVRAILRTYGYRINREKGWRVYHRGDEPEITGVVLRRDGTVDIPDAMKKQIALLSRDRAENQHRLAGYSGYRVMVRTRRRPDGNTPSRGASRR